MHNHSLHDIMLVADGHQHKEQLQNPLYENDFISELGTLNNSEQLSSVAPQPETVKDFASRQASTPPFYLLEGLYQQARQLNPIVFFKVKQTQQQIEDRVYRKHFVDRQKYMEEFYMKKGLLGPHEEGTVDFYLRGMLSQAMWRSEQKVVNDIDADKVIVYKKRDYTKDDLAEFEKMDQMRMIKIRQGELKSKLDLLHQKMEQVKYYSEASFRRSLKQPPKINFQKLEQQLDYKSYGLDATRTKVASQYAVKMRQQQLERSKRHHARLERQSQRLMRQQQQNNYNKEVLRRERHDEVLSHYQKLKQQQLADHQKLAQRQSEFMKFLEEYKSKKPLYQKNEENYEKRYLIPKEKQIQSKLKQIHLSHRPVSLEQMKAHQKSYMQKKAQKMAKRQEQMRIIMSQRHTDKKDHYKGHFHQILAGEDRYLDPNQEDHMRRQKRRQYGQKLKAQHKPIVDEKKKKELEQLVALTERKNKKVRKRRVIQNDTTQDVNSEGGGQEYTYQEISDGNHKKDGLKFLQFARRIGERMKHKVGESKKESTQKDNLSSQSPREPIQGTARSRTRHNLSQHQIVLRDKRHLNSWQEDLRSDRLSEQQKLERVMVKSMLIDGKARNKEQLLRLAHFESPLLEIKQKAELDEHYISSIKAKVAMLSMND